MSVISVRLPNELLEEIDSKAHSLHLGRARYIRQAIEAMNKQVEKQIRARKMAKASLRVRKESMRVNLEFSEMEKDPND